MFTPFPIAPKQPRRVHSGQRARLRDVPVRGAHRVRPGTRRRGPTRRAYAAPRA